MIFSMSWQLPLAAGGLSIVLGLATCSDLSVEDRSRRIVVADEWHQQRMILLEEPPMISAEAGAEMDTAVLAASRADPAVYATRAQARRVGIDALPYLIGSDAGRRFLKAASPRAIARGEPALFCPATGVATAKTPTKRGDVASEALEACIADLPPTARDCGCRIIAIDDLVTVTREELAYATGSSARLVIPAHGIDSLLVAEENPTGDMLLRDLKGSIATISNGDGEQVTVRFLNGPVFRGRRIEVGFRRGRLAERIYAENDRGERLSLLIGFEPDELADSAGAWLAWPKGG